MKKKQYASGGLTIEASKPEQPKEDHSDAARIGCAYNLLKAIESKDVKAISDALYDAFSIMESEPHRDSNSFEAQNIKAGQD